MTTGLLERVQRESIFTRLDFRSKLGLLVTLTLVAFMWESPAMTGALVLFVLGACWVAGIQGSYIRRILIVMVPFFLILVFTQGFFAGELIRARTGVEDLTPILVFPQSWWLIGGAAMWWEGVLYAATILFKTLTMVLLVPLVVLTTDPNEMIVSLVKMRLPYKVAFILSATLRFFPLLLRRIELIIQAQRLRGMAIEELKPARRVKIYAKIAVPLILGAMVESQTLELVLQSKAFSGTGKRTYFREATLSAVDYAAMALTLSFLVAAVVLYVTLGWGRFHGRWI